MQFTTLLTTFVQLVEHALPCHFSRRVILILLTPFNFQNYLLVFLISRLRLPRILLLLVLLLWWGLLHIEVGVFRGCEVIV